jgi:uncharacterized protein YwgA
MRDERIERIAEIIAYVLQLVGGQLFSKTKLVKLLYLLDVTESRKQRNGGFTQIEFKSYYYGPYSEDIENGLSLLSEMGAISVGQRTSMDGNPYYHIKLHSVPDFGHLRDEDRRRIRAALSPLLNLNLQQLLDIAYETEEYSDVDFGEVIPL